MSLELAATFLIGAATVFISFFTVRVNRPKVESEAQLATVAAMRDVISTLREEVTGLRQRLTTLESEVRVLEDHKDQYATGVDILAGQVRELGGKPRWQNHNR